MLLQIDTLLQKYNIEELKDEFKKNNIHYKEQDDLLLVFNKFNSNFTSSLHQECRSLVIDIPNKKVINYSCPTPLNNDEGIGYLMKNNDFSYKIYQCYEGTLLSLFYHQNKWFLSTRRCLDASTSKWKNDISHFDLFMEVLHQSNYESFDQFTDKLDSSKTYHFILLHHLNRNYVDYEKIFGKDYKKLVLAYMRDNETMDLVSDIPSNLFDENILMSEEVDNISWLDEYNMDNKFSLPPKTEGLILRGNNKGKEVLIKLQSQDYQFASAVIPKDNLYIGLLKLYQLDKLKEYLEKEENKEKFEIITNPLNPKESFHTIGIIDSVFKVLTTELKNLYETLYDEEANSKDNEMYQFLPKIYKFFMFKFRGINYKKNSYGKEFTVKDIYYFLKKIEVYQIDELIRSRKLLFNQIYQNKTDKINQLKEISYGIDKVNLKLINLFTSKLYPEILPTDIE